MDTMEVCSVCLDQKHTTKCSKCKAEICKDCWKTHNHEYDWW